MTPAIRVENLSKRYHIGPNQAGGYRTLRESIMDTVKAPWHRLRRWAAGRAAEKPTPTAHWALRDISFEVEPGEVLGIIGRNGAGKSTLLKVLSRITEPTSGRAELRGRIVSLLEVGTGFHQELTGRENIYLNGAILGMSRREIDRKFDDIVAFAEIEKFLDTPSKRYSSGMYIRLAFAVAAHLDAEILVVDEVLAVGDAAFQKKCLDRMRALGKSGATILFVSHNMGTVASLCQSALVLEDGRLIGRGEAREQVRLYLNTLHERTAIDIVSRTDRSGTGVARLTEVSFLDGQDRPIESAMGGEPLTIRLSYRAKAPLANAEVHIWVANEHGVPVTMLSSRYNGDLLSILPPEGALECSLPEVSLAPGSYLLSVSLVAGLDVVDSVPGAARLEVEPGPFFATGRTPGAENGLTLTRHSWSPASPADVTPSTSEGKTAS
jgi:lipopolysaccharide transport system ATP-binding protein